MEKYTLYGLWKLLHIFVINTVKVRTHFSGVQWQLSTFIHADHKKKMLGYFSVEYPGSLEIL